MREFEPREATAAGLLLEACAKRLHALAQAQVRSDLAGEVPRLQNAAHHAAEVAKVTLDQLLVRLAPKRQRKAARNA